MDMDIETQMEANGLPKQFGSTTEEATDSHVAANLAATTSHSEIVPAPNLLKQVNSPSLLHPEPVQSDLDESIPPKMESTTNGDHDRSDVPAPNGIAKISEVLREETPPQPVVLTSSLPEPQPIAPVPQPDFTTNSISASSLGDSVIPSSIPSAIPSSDPTTEPELSQPTIETAIEPMALPPQPPISDLRTSPHADQRSPEEVAQIEAEKHRQDNEIDQTPVVSAPEPMDISAILEPAEPEPSILAEAPPIEHQGLSTPPAASPPPAPQPAPATLPVEQPIMSSTEPMDIEQVTEKPVEPVPTPAEPITATEIQADQPMTDAPSSPSKHIRERDDDQDDSEHAAKRMRTEEVRQESEQSDFKVPDVPAASPGLTNGTPTPSFSGPADGDDQVTASRLAHMKKVISNLKKSNASQAFRIPVDPLSLNIPNYPEIVKQPMDLGTIDNKLKQAQYSSVKDFVTEFELIVNNCVLFNGRDHGVTQQALKMQSSFNNQMANLPRASVEEPTKEQKKAAKTKTEPTRSAPPRRPSVSTVPPTPTGTARSPKAVTPSQSFAPGPDGVPLIRRDSNVVDGRPKRAIVPPKRNQEFAGGRPKKKKYELQLRFCQEALKEITSPKHWQINQYFTHPVDPVALNIPTYFQLIKKPMDLGTVQTKLDNNVYEKAKDFEEDVRLVFRNCYKFNPEGDFVNQCGHQLEDLFSQKWATKDEWIASREPVSEPQSDAEDDEDDEASDEEGEEDSDDERTNKIVALQKQIAEMSKQMGELTQPKKPKKKSKSPVPAKKRKLSKSGKKDKPGATFPNLGKSGKEKKKSSGSKSKSEKDRYVTFAEKQYISNGIAMLPEKQMQDALKIIQSSVPSLANSDQNEIELDIEEVPNHALLKLLNFVKKYAGPPPDEPKLDLNAYSAPSTSKSKKNKPMSKSEQEAQIEELKGKLGAYGGPVSPNAVPSIETGDDSSDDDGDSEESEEE